MNETKFSHPHSLKLSHLKIYLICPVLLRFRGEQAHT